MSEKSEYKDELRNLELAARELAPREDLRVAKVTDKALVKKFKEEKGLQWFDQFSSSSLVMFRK